MKQVKEFLRTFIMTVIILFILSGFISPEIASFADRPSPNRVDSVGLKMLPLGTQEDFNRAGAARDVQRLVNIMAGTLGGSQSRNMPASRLDGRGVDEGFVLDGNNIEIVDSEEGDWGTIEVPVSLLHENYSNDAYVGNLVPASSYSDYFSDDAEEEPEEESAVDGDSQTSKLQGTILGAQGRRALINGEVWTEGDLLGEYRLVRIQSRRVFLKADDGSFVSFGM